MVRNGGMNPATVPVQQAGWGKIHVGSGLPLVRMGCVWWWKQGWVIASQAKTMFFLSFSSFFSCSSFAKSERRGWVSEVPEESVIDSLPEQLYALQDSSPGMCVAGPGKNVAGGTQM